MKAIKNTYKEDIILPFNGTNYHFPIGKVVMINEEVWNFLNSNFPLSFTFSPKVEKGTPIPKAKEEKTKVYIKSTKIDDQMGKGDMMTDHGDEKPTFGGADVTPPDGTTDKDGVEWYGEGITVEGGQNVS